MPTSIVFTISKDGQVQERVEGFAGQGCKALTAPIEAALGGAVISSDATAEFYQQESSDVSVTGGPDAS